MIDRRASVSLALINRDVYWTALLQNFVSVPSQWAFAFFTRRFLFNSTMARHRFNCTCCAIHTMPAALRCGSYGRISILGRTVKISHTRQDPTSSFTKRMKLRQQYSSWNRCGVSVTDKKFDKHVHVDTFLSGIVQSYKHHHNARASFNTITYLIYNCISKSYRPSEAEASEARTRSPGCDEVWQGLDTPCLCPEMPKEYPTNVITSMQGNRQSGPSRLSKRQFFDQADLFTTVWWSTMAWITKLHISALCKHFK